MLSQPGSDVIYNLGTWLNALGLKLTVAVCTDTEDNTANAEMTQQLFSPIQKMPNFRYSSLIDATVETVWNFYERPDILQLLTPPWQPVQDKMRSDIL